jgi:uncharacterized membrane protein
LRVRIAGAGPYAILAAAATVLAASWAAIPTRFAVQWGANGAPSRFVERAPLAVAFPLVIGACVALLLRAIALALPRSQGADANRSATTRALLATEYLVASVFAVAALATALAWSRAPWIITGAALGGVAALVAYLLTASRGLAAAQLPHGRADAWKWRVFYMDGNDPALIVPKRIGLGYTLNFGHTGAWLAIGVLVAVALVFLASRARG